MGQIWQNSIPYSGAGSTDYIDLTTTLTAGSTSVTILNNAFNENSVVDFFSDPYGIIPTNAVISPGLITITFNPQSQDVDILVRVYKEKGTGGGIYHSGKLINIDSNNLINVRMEKSTPEDIEEQSLLNPNTLFFTEGILQIISVTTAVLSSTGWEIVSDGWSQSVQVNGITATSNIIVSPSSANNANFENYCASMIRAKSQAEDTIVFFAESKPELAIDVVIAYWG